MKDEFTREWITRNSIQICNRYEYGVLTLRALHYQLVSIGMTNSMRHYKRVVAAMIKARREGIIAYEQFSDHDREVIGATRHESTSLEDSIQSAKEQVEAWMTNYARWRWEEQPIVPEVWIEKKALQGVFQTVCLGKGVALAPCKGYPSLTFLNEAVQRFREVIDQDKQPMILYFGDYDATGEDIPRSIQDNLYEIGGIHITVRRIALMEDQVISMGLPPAPTKSTDSRAKNWDGLGQVELDAVDPDTLQEMLRDAIDDVFDEDIYDVLQERVEEERKEYRVQLKKFVNEEIKD